MSKKRVAAMVVLDDGKFLILKRSDSSSSPGLWNFPGGGIEEDETPMEAAIRELHEEAGIVVEEDDAKYVGEILTKRMRIYFYITDEYSGDVKINKESSDFKWVKPEDSYKYKFVGDGVVNENLMFFILKFMRDGL